MTKDGPLESLVGRGASERRLVLAALLEEALHGPVALIDASAVEFYTCGVLPHEHLEIAAPRAPTEALLESWGFRRAGSRMVAPEHGLSVRIWPSVGSALPYRVSGRRIHICDLGETLRAMLVLARRDPALMDRAEILFRVHRDRIDLGGWLDGARATGLGAWAEEVMRRASMVSVGGGEGRTGTSSERPRSGPNPAMA